MDGSTFTPTLGTNGHMQRRIRWEENKYSVDRRVAGGVCRLMEGSNVERLYRVWTSELCVSELKHAVVQLVEALRYKKEGRSFHSQWRHWDFSLAYSFRPHCGSVIDSATNRNEYQEYYVVGKDGHCVGLILPPSCADCLEMWAPQNPGTLRASTGLAFYVFINIFIIYLRSIWKARQVLSCSSLWCVRLSVSPAATAVHRSIRHPLSSQ